MPSIAVWKSSHPQPIQMHLILPLISSLLYVVAALFLKQAAQRGVGIWRTGMVCNAITAIAFLTLWPLGGTLLSWTQLWQPGVVALLFVGGQMSTFLALEKGDVSLVTPVMGAKVVLVALLSTWINADHVSLALWFAAALSCAGVVLLNRRPRGGHHHHVALTIWLALQAASAYALFDILVMKWSPNWGAGRFLPIVMLLAAIFSVSFIPLFHESMRAMRSPQWKALLPGALFIALQAIVLVSTLAIFGDATAVNVIYSLRGLWSVAAVWLVGHWFGNLERETGAEVLGWRLAGAVLLSTAVVLVFV